MLTITINYLFVNDIVNYREKNRREIQTWTVL